MDLKELSTGVDPLHYWYYQSKKIPLMRCFNRLKKENKTWDLLDIGAGNGFFSKELLRSFPDLIKHTRLVDQAYTSDDLKTGQPANLLLTRELPSTIQHSFVLMMDVLEHIEDDAAFLKTLKQRSVTGNSNYFFITVPAFNSLWSGHDIYLAHYRRYTRRSLQALLIENGFHTDRLYYLYSSFLPLVFIRRRLSAWFFSSRQPASDLKPLPGWLNSLLLKYARLEMKWLPYPKSFGLTCVAEGTF